MRADALTRPLSPAVSRFAALGLLVLLVLIFIVAVVEPWRDAYEDAAGTAARLRAAIAHAGAAERDPASLRAELEHRAANPQSTAGYLAGANDALASAELQDRIKSLVENQGGKLRSTQILPSRDEGGFRRITVRGEIMVDITGLQRVVYALESATPMLFLDNVEIRAIPSTRDAAAGPDLEVRFDLYGYLRRPA
jgi:general secretion pathway protein M